MRRLVILPQNIVDTSRKYGHAIVQWYAANPDAAVRAGIWGAELDPERQGHGKAGEYAVAQYCGLPRSAVRSDVGNGADKGEDLVAYGQRIDAKCTPTWKQWLLWSQAVNDLYWSKAFDVIVSVSIDDQDWSRCWIEGWLTKQEFFHYKKIADGSNDAGKLTRGTWFMDKQPLPDIHTLRAGCI
jgi:hypothetical protein